MVFLVGVVLIVLTFVWSTPRPSDLVEVHGHLDSFHFKQLGTGRSAYATVFTLLEGDSFYTGVLTKEQALERLRYRATDLRFYVDKKSRHSFRDGTRRTYGLWVAGKKLQPLAAALRRENLFVRVAFPIIGCALVSRAVYFHRRRIKRERNIPT